MTKTLPMSEVKTRLPELVTDVEEREEEVVVTKNGLPPCLSMSREYARLIDTLDVLSDPALMQQIAESRTFYRRGKKGLSFKDAFGAPVTLLRRRRTA